MCGVGCGVWVVGCGLWVLGCGVGVCGVRGWRWEGWRGIGGGGGADAAQKKAKKKSSKKKRGLQWNKKAANLWVYVKGERLFCLCVECYTWQVISLYLRVFVKGFIVFVCFR